MESATQTAIYFIMAAIFGNSCSAYLLIKYVGKGSRLQDLLNAFYNNDQHFIFCDRHKPVEMVSQEHDISVPDGVTCFILMSGSDAVPN